MKVLFENSKSQTREIAEVETMEQAYEEINKFCTERNFEIRYMRNWKQGNVTIVDVGSHTEFFHIVEEVVEIQETEENKLSHEEAIEWANNVVEAFSKVGISVRDDNGELKSFEKIMEEASDVWNEGLEQKEVDKSTNEDEAIELVKNFFYEELDFCACGNPNLILEVIKNVLLSYVGKYGVYGERKEHGQFIKEVSIALGYGEVDINKNDIAYGVYQIIANLLDSKGYLEHGSSIGGAWLTSEGKELLEALCLIKNYDDVFLC